MDSMHSSLASICNVVVTAMVQRHCYSLAVRIFQEVLKVVQAGLLNQTPDNEASFNRSCSGIYETIHQFHSKTSNDSTSTSNPTMCDYPFDVHVVVHDEVPKNLKRQHHQQQKDNSGDKECINILLVEINSHCHIEMENDDDTSATSFNNTELLSAIVLQNYASALFCLALSMTEAESTRKIMIINKAYTMYKMSVQLLCDTLRLTFSLRDSDPSDNNLDCSGGSVSTMMALAAMNTAVVLSNLIQITTRVPGLEFITEEERQRIPKELKSILLLIKHLKEANLLPVNCGNGTAPASAA